MPLPIYNEQTPPSAGCQIKNKITHVIGVAAGKGGVGKSTISCALARALVNEGNRVGLLDADLYGPSLRQMLKEQKPPSPNGAMIVPALCEGIKLMSMAYFRPSSEAFAIRAPIANGAIRQFVTGVDWGDLDYLIIDFPPGTGDIQLTIGQLANLSGAILVTTPQEVANLDVRKAANLFLQLKIPLIGIVENFSYYLAENGGAPQYVFGKEGGKRLAKELEAPLLAELPIDPAISLSGDSGSSFLTEDGNGRISLVIKNLMKGVKLQLEEIKKSSKDALGHFDLEWQEMKEGVFSPSEPHFNEDGFDGRGISVKKICQVSNHCFQITWSDGKNSVYQLSELQKMCPCAKCSEKLSIEKVFSDDLRAKRVYSVGRYGLRIEFSSGCRAGIFDFPWLYSKR